MAGVDVRVSTIGGPSPTNRDRATQLFAVGLAERGPTDRPVKVTSIGDFTARFGGRTTYSWLYETLDVFFREGGQMAQIARVVGPAATLGTVSIGTEARIDALGAGSWSEDLTVEIAEGSMADTVIVRVLFDGDVVETYRNVDTVVRLAELADARSSYITVTDLGGDGTLAVGTYELSAGSDDRASVTTQHRIDALELFGKELGPGVAVIPGADPEAVIDGLRDHAASHDRLALVAAPQGSTLSDVTDLADELRSDPDADAHIGVLWPWIRVPVAGGRTRTIPPEGFVAGRRAATISGVGVWQPPAGAVNGSAGFVTATETYIDKDDATAANEAGLIPIRTINSVPVIYGWRSLSADLDNWQWLQWRDLVNLASQDARDDIEEFVFRTVDAEGNLLSEVYSKLVAIGERYRPGLFARINENGDELDPGYTVDTGRDMNPTEQLAAGLIRGRLALRPSPAGELIIIDVAKAAVTAAL